MNDILMRRLLLRCKSPASRGAGHGFRGMSVTLAPVSSATRLRDAGTTAQPLTESA